jgi:hypothetical protein
MSNNKVVEDQNVAYGVASIVCSVLSWLVLGIVLAPLGVVFGCIGLTKGKQSKILSAIGLAIGAVALAVIIISFIAASAILTRVR